MKIDGDEGEVGCCVGGVKEDRLAAYEWISLFWHEAGVRLWWT